MSITRKCKECNKDIDMTLENIENIIYFDKKYYHLECFIQMCEKKSQSKRCSKKWAEALLDLDGIKRDSKEFISNVIYKDLIYDFMLKNYDLKVIPNIVFQKLDAFYSGQFKGLSQPIKPEELYEMWITKMNYLNKVNVRNMQLGKSIEGGSRIKYDLSILLNKYDDYLSWKKKQKTNKEVKKQLEKDIVKETKIKKAITNIHPTNISKEEDMDDILDDIFG